MTLAIARRYPSVIRRLAFVRRVPLGRSEAQCVNPSHGVNIGLPTALNQSMPALPLRLKNGYATQSKTGTRRKTTASKSTTKRGTKTGTKTGTKSRAKSTAKSRGTKTRARKTTTSRKTATKRKTTRGRPKKKLTATEKEDEARKALKRRIKALKEAALSPPKRLPDRSIGVFVSESTLPFQERAKGYKSLSESEVSRLKETAKANAEKNRANYDQWVKTHSPLEIRNANLARASLRRLKYHPRTYTAIKDDRQVNPPLPPYGFFMRESAAAGELDGLSVPQAGARMGQMWRSLSENEKNKYRDMSLKDRDRYIGEFKAQYHHDPPLAKAAKKKSA